ncbi:hypothetical protein NQ317_006127 [Molorchus minor]|uniref:C2H2-type domain-containing protein n=1 Tax=Molorchus minor TaxID=1323400 RepID=A0ABQ9IXT5_9CUCU|nr:hypothetical protein NQ317_006127 [Molorchus minor]
MRVEHCPGSAFKYATLLNANISVIKTYVLRNYFICRTEAPLKYRARVPRNTRTPVTTPLGAEKVTPALALLKPPRISCLKSYTACIDCNKSLSQAANLIGARPDPLRERSHSGVRCAIGAFPKLVGDDHMRTHSGERPYRWYRHKRSRSSIIYHRPATKQNRIYIRFVQTELDVVSKCPMRACWFFTLHSDCS